MKISELLLPEFDTEMATTRRILERVPDSDGKGAWKPHPKAFPLAHLAQLVMRLPAWIPLVLRQTEFDIAPVNGTAFPGYSIETTATLLAGFDKAVTEARAAIASLSDEEYQVPWHFKRAGVVQFTQPRYQMLRSMALNHVVHHRAQLGMYLRLLDEKVPSMYGPTADDRP